MSPSEGHLKRVHLVFRLLDGPHANGFATFRELENPEEFLVVERQNRHAGAADPALALSSGRHVLR